MTKCKICNKPIKENTEGDLRYCQGHDVFEVEDSERNAFLSDQMARLGLDEEPNLVYAELQKEAKEVYAFKESEYDKWKAYWESVGGSFTSCVKKVKDNVSDANAFCASLEHFVTGKWPREK